MCLPLESLPPPTEKAKSSVSNLQIIAFLHLAIIFTKLIIALDLGALFEIIIIIILWSAWAQLSHCSCIFYIIFCLYYSLIIFVLFATRKQNGKTFFGDTPKEQAILLVYFVAFFFYLFASYMTFLSYREFKAILFEQEGHQYQQPAQQQGRYDEERPQQYQNSNGTGFQAFAGRGVSLG